MSTKQSISKDDIVIRKTVLHILDTVRGVLNLSDSLLDPGPDLYEFIRGHIFKVISSDDTKNCEFNPDTSAVYSIVKELDESNEQSFLSVSRELAEKLYSIMEQSLDIPAADLLSVSFQANGTIFLALLKMNYKSNYTHSLEATHTDIVKASALPASGTRIPEAIVINLTDFHINLLEKRYEINGEKAFYLSELFLVCHTSLAPKKKLSVIDRTINIISNKYDGTDIKKKMDTKSKLRHLYQEEEQFDIEKIGKELFGNDADKRTDFDDKMEQYDLQFDTFSVNNPSTLKKLEKQVLVTDSGIEISIPMDTYDKRANFEVQTDTVTGKITVLIKNIENLILK